MDIWTKSETKTFISLLRRCPCLYDPKHIDHANKAKRIESFNFIIEAMKDIRPCLTLTEAYRKKKTLCAQFSREKRRISQNKPAALWCYYDLLFLDRNKQNASNTSKLDEEELLLDDSNWSHTDYETDQTNFNDDTVRADYLCEIDEELTQFIDEASVSDTEETEDPTFNKLSNDSYKTDLICNIKEQVCDMKDSISPYKKRVSEKLIEEAREALKLAKSYAEQCEDTNKEDEFCRYLCSELKKLQLEDTVADLKIEILNLVRQAIKNERALLQNQNK